MISVEQAFATATRFIESLNAADFDTLASLYNPQVVLTMMPNFFYKSGNTVTFESMMQGARMSMKSMTDMHWDAKHMATGPNVAIIEYHFSGKLAMDMGPTMPAGTPVRTRSITVLEFDEEGKIILQRTYDVYDGLKG